MKVPRKIRVVPLAFESLGVRSMCTYVETPDVKILLDAGVSLGPRRFGLPPHPKEYAAIKKIRERMLNLADKVDVVTVSHYHFDHQTPSYTDWAYNWSSAEIAERVYSGKIVFMKSYRSKINTSQRRRGWMFVQTGGKYAERLETADGRAFRFGDTSIRFSKPVFHGEEGSQLGWIVMTTIERNSEKVLYTSDVQGPMIDGTLETILSEKPDLIIVGGPPLYLAGLVKSESIMAGMRNLGRIVEAVPTTILDHHLLRDKGWREAAKPVLDTASKMGHMIVTAAEYVGEKNALLESQRKELYEAEPPNKDFNKWVKMPILKRKLIKPPI